MDYAEAAPPPALAGLIKTRWTLAANGAAGEWIEQQATPDGCIELIRRTHGRSRWDGDQPASFVVGLVDRPQAFTISGDARFEALRLWPWAWTLLGGAPLAALHGRWQPCPAPDFAAIERRLSGAAALNATGRAIIAAPTVAAMGASTGMEPRALQRWFTSHVGLAPRHYLRLLRFQKAFETLPGEARLADQAADGGFADQAHMAREFRELAGVPARQARARAKGPFLR